MGRPKEFDSDTVLAAAMDCFWSDGISRTSISSLVEAMKIQRSSFYNSFSSRDGILAIVLDRYLAASPLNKLIQAKEQHDGTEPDLQLVDLILEFSHFLAEDGNGRGCLFFNGLSELTKQDEQAFELYQDARTQLTDGLTYLLERVEQQRDGSDQVGTVEIDHFLFILIGMAHFSKLDPSELRLAKLGLDQLAGLSGHFAGRIQERAATNPPAATAGVQSKMTA